LILIHKHTQPFDSHIHIHMHIHMHIHTYIHTYINTYIHTHTYTYIHTYPSGRRPSASSILQKKLADRDANILCLKTELATTKQELATTKPQLEAALADNEKRLRVHLHGIAKERAAKAQTSAKNAKTAADVRVAKANEVANRNIAKAWADATAAISAANAEANAEATAAVAKATEEAAATVAAANDGKQAAVQEREKAEKDIEAYSRGDLGQLSKKGWQLKELMEKSGFGAEVSTLRDEKRADREQIDVLSNEKRELAADLDNQKALKNGQASSKRAAEQELAGEKRKVQKRDVRIRALQVRKRVLL
jgi:hypothetical protein